MIGDLNPNEIEALLSSEVVGRIGCSAHGVTYVVPIAYAYDEGFIYGHSKEGMKIQMMRANPMVCFEIDNMADIENWRSVVAWGRFEELKGNEKRTALQKIINRLSPLTTDKSTLPCPEEAHQASGGQYKTVIYRIKLLEKTGKFEVPGPPLSHARPLLEEAVRT